MNRAASDSIQPPAIRVGPLASLKIRSAFWFDPVRCMQRCAMRYGPAIALTTISAPGRSAQIDAVLLVGPDYNRRVLTATEAVRPSGLWNVRGPEGSAQHNFRRDYLSTHGEEHAIVSGAVAPHLRKATVETKFAALKDIVLEDTAHWPSATPFDLYARVRLMAQIAAFKLLFGEEDGARAHTCGRLLADYHDSNWVAAAHALPVNCPGLPYRQTLQRAEALQSFLLSWVGERRGTHRQADIRASFANMTDSAGNHLRPGKITGYLSFLAFASYETMSSALSWTLFLLAQNPGASAELRAELTDCGPVEAMTSERLMQLPVLDGVINESLRLIPPTPYIPFRTTAPWDIAGCELRAGTQIFLSPWLTHRLPEIYDDPAAFRPNRWAEIKPSPYEFLPFSNGPRRCPGAHFATLFMKLALAALLPKHDLSLAPGGRVRSRFTGITMPRAKIPFVLTTLAQQGLRTRAA